MAKPKPADTRIEGAANDAAIKEMTPAVETIRAFAREIALLSWQAFVPHGSAHRKASQSGSHGRGRGDPGGFSERVHGTCGTTYKKVHRNAGDLPARAGATGKRGGRECRGRKARHHGEGRAPFRSCP